MCCGGGVGGGDEEGKSDAGDGGDGGVSTGDDSDREKDVLMACRGKDEE